MDIVIARLGQLLERLSSGSIPVNLPDDLREWNLVANRMLIIAFIYWIPLYGLGLLIALAQIFQFEPREKVYALMSLFIPNYIVVALTVPTAAYFKIRRIYEFTRQNQFRFFYGFVILVSLLLFWSALLTPFSVPFSLLNLPVLQLLIALRDHRRIDFMQVFTGIIVIASGTCGALSQIWRGAPIPLPDYVLVWGSPFIIIMLIGFCLAIVFYLRHETDKTKLRINAEREKSEKLLLNILPKQVADELKETGKNAPHRIHDVTIIFTDFVGFTRISENLTPEDLVLELDRCFSYFDTVCEKYNLEKLKTIGDSFMCAGGLPTANKTHPYDCALAALEIQSFMRQMKEIKEAAGLPYWELRLGMHTGPVVAGVVGEKKFAYDIWGDTVNTASRMESSGVPEHINISAETHLRLEEYFSCAHRGRVYAKNKGEIDMYFLEGIKPNYSVNSEGRVPTQDLLRLFRGDTNSTAL